MTAADFRRIARSFPDVEEGTHAGQPDFRVAGRKFATLASVTQGYGNIQLPLDTQAAFVAEAPNVFLPVPSGFGRMGHTHIILAAADEATLAGALQAAYKFRVNKNAKPAKKKAVRKLTSSHADLRLDLD